MSRVRAAEGVLVCVTFVGPRSRCAGALKLQIISDHGATLTRLNSGEVRLSAVKDVLDRPGDLQKGVVYPDLRATSSAVVGDKVNVRDANYFVEAMGLRLDERDKDAFGLLAQATADVVGVGDAPRVVRALSRARAHSVDEVLAEAAETEPLLDEATQARIIEELANRDRPVRQVDTQAALKRTIRVGDVTISGPARDLEDVATRPHPDGGREVVLRLDGDWHDRYHT